MHLFSTYSWKLMFDFHRDIFKFQVFWSTKATLACWIMNYNPLDFCFGLFCVFCVFCFCSWPALYFALDEWGFFSCRLATALIVSPCFRWQTIGLLHKNMQSCMFYHSQDSFWNLILGAASHRASQQGYSHAEKDASIKGILESIVGFCIVNRYPRFRGSIF